MNTTAACLFCVPCYSCLLWEEYHRRLSVLCTLLFLSLVGAMGIMQSQPINVTGMYGTILLHEDAGGYVLVAVISFTAAVVITALCIKFKKRG